jgi:hypothetical protein
MALGELTRQLAQQALGNQVKEALEGKPSGPAPAENVGTTIVGQIQAMQNALKEDQELVVLVQAGAEMIRVLEVFLPSSRVAVLAGVDGAKNVTRVIAPIESLQLVCKVVRASMKPSRITFVLPKAKAE